MATLGLQHSSPALLTLSFIFATMACSFNSWHVQFEAQATRVHWYEPFMFKTVCNQTDRGLFKNPDGQPSGGLAVTGIVGTVLALAQECIRLRSERVRDSNIVRSTSIGTGLLASVLQASSLLTTSGPSIRTTDPSQRHCEASATGSSFVMMAVSLVFSVESLFCQLLQWRSKQSDYIGFNEVVVNNDRV